MKENDIRPQELFDELLRLIKLDVDIHFSKANTKKINCPVCETKGVYSFTKNNFSFDECIKCKSLYVSPRPDKKYFDAYYKDSKSAKYWATTFYKETEKNRREMLWKPKAKIIKEKIDRFALNTETIVDIGGGYGTFIEEFLKISKINHIIVEPSEHLSKICEQKGLNVNKNFLEDIRRGDLPKSKKTFVSFELFEHLHNPKRFLEILNDLMEIGDSFIFTTLSGMGLDIQSLWEESKSLSPPMHLNFLNPKSLETLLNNIGFNVIEILTPGKLDIDIMNNNIDKIKEKFWRNFLDYSSIQEKNNMQKFLAENKLSSHMMIVCQKL
jgi:hypothetical protein